MLEPTDPGDTAAILYTSGTTGRPKGAELSHFQLYMNAETPGRLFGIRDDDIVLVVLPALPRLRPEQPAQRVHPLRGDHDASFRASTPAKVLEVIQRDRVTIFEGVPTMYIALLNYPRLDDYDVSSLRVGISGGAPIPAEIIDAVEQKFGIVILEGYGMTETASTATFNISAEERKIYSVGKPIWGVEVQIWNEQGQPLPPGAEHVGELVVRGVNTPNGYFKNAGGHGGGLRRRLVPHRRSRLLRRGRVLLHRRPQEGPHHPRRLQRLSRARSRRSSTPTRAWPRRLSSASRTSCSARTSRRSSS